MKEQNLALLAHSGNFSLFSYKTEDTSKQVEQEGYFAPLKSNLRKGCILLIECRDKQSMYKVIDNNGSVADMINVGKACSFTTADAIEDVAIDEVAEKYDRTEIDSNFCALSSTINDILTVLRQNKIINS